MKLIIERKWYRKMSNGYVKRYQGEAVFVVTQNKCIHIAVVLILGDDGAFIKYTDGTEGYYSYESIKPFDPAKIGLPWEEI